MKRLKLEIELIPEGSWGLNLAHLLPRPVWDSLRRDVYKKFNYTCAICEAGNTRMNCHEIWKFEDRKHIQYLVAFQSVCDNCHNVKHWGRTVTMVHEGKYPPDYLDILTKHFCEVNNCSQETFQAHKVEMGNLYQIRSRYKYRIEFGDFRPDRVVKIWRGMNK